MRVRHEWCSSCVVLWDSRLFLCFCKQACSTMSIEPQPCRTVREMDCFAALK
jgi:hypothetical protein